MTVSHADYRMACRTRLLTLAVATTDGDYSRASTATYVDGSGVVQTAAIDEARTAHYVNGVGPAALYEAAATNLALRSESFDDAAWTNVGSPTVSANAVAAPDGATTADTITDASAAESRGKRQTVAVANDATTYTASVYLAKTVGTPVHFPCMNLRFTGGTLVDAYVVVNTTTGALFDSVVSTASAESVGNYWRVSLTVANNASGNTSALLSLYPAWRGDLTATDLDVSITGAATFWGAQLEAGSAATSYIPTAAASATRSADLGGLTATTTGYTRTVGSFVTDGYRRGMEVTPAGFSDTTKRTITNVEALTLTVDGTPTAQSVSGGRTLTVALPSVQSYENVPLTPTADVPYVGERYFPGTLAQFGATAQGWMEATALYQVDVHVPQNAGPDALDRYADAVTAHFPPTIALTTGDGTTVRVRGDGGLSRSPILPSPSVGWQQVSITVPLRIYTPNSI